MDAKILIKQIADNHLDSFVTNGFADAGQNGPYGDKDTAIRNTAHWSVIYSYLYRTTKEKKYESVIDAFTNYLLDSRNYGVNGAAKCRERKQGKGDDVNGVIGQAWVIEGLLALYEVSKNQQLLDTAYKCYKSQVFDANLGLWRICNTDGNATGFDWTFNHHLWLAAAASDLLCIQNYDDVSKDIECFIDRLDKTWAVHCNGIMFHQCNIRPGFLNWVKYQKMRFERFFKINEADSKAYSLQEGYQMFDLYGFAKLVKNTKSSKLLQSSKLKRAINKGLNESFISSLSKPNFNTYAYPYNSPAFEYPFVSKVFGKYDNHLADSLLNIQMEHFYDGRSHSFSRNNFDANTLTARIYELVSFLEI